MSLRRKLILLHTLFAAFAVAAASAVIYGVEIHVGEAMRTFAELNAQSLIVEQVRIETQSQISQLHDIVDGRRTDDESAVARREAYFTRLAEVGRFAGATGGGLMQGQWLEIRDLGERLRAAFDECLSLAREEGTSAADKMLAERIEGDLIRRLDGHLLEARRMADLARQRSGSDVLAVNTQLLWLAALIGASGVGLVVAGAIVVRRWFIAPIAALHAGTREFAGGKLDHRISVSTGDELGALGDALNSMASSLCVSQTKYRSLFENQRDAIIIVDGDGVVCECRDADTPVIATDPRTVIGRRLLDGWSEWRRGNYDWEELTRRVAIGRERVRALGVVLPREAAEEVVVDIMAYPVEYGGIRYAAILLRDASERLHLQRLSRRAEMMEASVSFARGIAHDFKNLLNNAVTTLSLIDENHPDADRARKAIASCQQAAGLSRKLSEFADTGTGSPELLCLTATVELILSSLEESLPANIEVIRGGGPPIQVLVDRDYLTQVVLNLLQNAREAMEAGGQLQVATGVTLATHPLQRGTPRPFGVLSVCDTGPGMSAAVKNRLFEPLFSTKHRNGFGRRGMGLAIVYAAVSHAGGFVQIDSTIGRGSTFRVYLPVAAQRTKPDYPPTPPGSSI